MAHNPVDADKLELAYIKEHARRISGHSKHPCIVTNCPDVHQALRDGAPLAMIHHLADAFDVETVDMLLLGNTTSLQDAVLWAAKVRLGGVFLFRTCDAAVIWFRYVARPTWGPLRSYDTVLAVRKLDILEVRDAPLRHSAEWWLHSEHATFFLGVSMMQQWVDLVVWENLLSANKDLQAVIELGTSAGGMALFLRLQTLQRGMQFWTFDINRPPEVDTGEVAKRLGLAGCFRQADLLSDTGQVQVIEFLGDPLLHPLLLFIDLFKPRMFDDLAPHLQEGDIVGVHDFNGQFFQKHTEVMKGRLAPYLFKPCEELGGITRFWKVVA